MGKGARCEHAGLSLTPQNPQKTAHGRVSVTPLFLQYDREPETGGAWNFRVSQPGPRRSNNNNNKVKQRHKNKCCLKQGGM